MKKSYYVFPFPLIVLSYVILGFSLYLFYFDRISLLTIIIAIVVALIVVTFKTSYHVYPVLSELRIYRKMLFYKIGEKTIRPKIVVILTKIVYRTKIDGKYGGGGVTSDYLYQLIIYDMVEGQISYEKSGYIDHIEELGTFISNSLKIELKHKKIELDNTY